MTKIAEDLAAYTSNLVGRIGSEAAEKLFDGQIGRARLIMDNVLREGQRAPEFTLPDAMGARVSLYQLLEHSPVVLTFYRGGWCPYCNIALRALQSHLQQIRQCGAELVAISPERPDESLSSQEKMSLAFPVLSDHDNEVARRFGLVYRVSDDARTRLLALGRNLVEHNATDRWELPMTATYIIDRDGVITFDHVDADYRNRLDPVALLAVLHRKG